MEGWLEMNTYSEDRATEAVAAAGGQQGQHHGEDHDGQPKCEAGNASLPSVGKIIVILTQHLLLQLVQIWYALSLENLSRKFIEFIINGKFPLLPSSPPV